MKIHHLAYSLIAVLSLQKVLLSYWLCRRSCDPNSKKSAGRNGVIIYANSIRECANIAAHFFNTLRLTGNQWLFQLRAFFRGSMHWVSYICLKMEFHSRLLPENLLSKDSMLHTGGVFQRKTICAIKYSWIGIMTYFPTRVVLTAFCEQGRMHRPPLYSRNLEMKSCNKYNFTR